MTIAQNWERAIRENSTYISKILVCYAMTNNFAYDLRKSSWHNHRLTLSVFHYYPNTLPIIALH